jgi:hypothetical protein
MRDSPSAQDDKTRFKKFFGFDASGEVRDFNLYIDGMGMDNLYQASFNCDTITIQTIVKDLKLSLSQTTVESAIGMNNDFSWWDIEAVKRIKPYFRYEGKHENYWYLWYDTVKAKAYYCEYDM